jgi:hypothetical protein
MPLPIPERNDTLCFHQFGETVRKLSSFGAGWMCTSAIGAFSFSRRSLQIGEQNVLIEYAQ